MTDDETKDQEPTVEPDASVSAGSKPSSALSSIRREISDEELSSPGALKLLIDRLDRSENRVVQLEEFQKNYHKRDKRVGILEEKLQKEGAFEILYSFSLALGAVFSGLAPSAWGNQPYGWISLTAGILLMLGSIAGYIYRGKK